MTSTTNTGGLKKFVYSKNQEQSKLTFQEELEYEEAWQKARIRKKKERVRKNIILLIIIIAIITLYLILR